VLCLVSTGLIYKAFCLGLGHFYGKLCPFVTKICSTNGPSPVEDRGATLSQVIIKLCLIQVL